MHWPCLSGLAASAGLQLRATGNGNQCHPVGHEAQEGLYLTLLTSHKSVIK